MLIAQFGCKKKKQSIQFVHIVNALVKRQNPKLQRLFQVHDHCCNTYGLRVHIQSDREGWGWVVNRNNTEAKTNLQASTMLPQGPVHSPQCIHLHLSN